MSTSLEQEDEISLIRISQYVTDSEGRRIAAIVDMEELRRVEELIEDTDDLLTAAEEDDAYWIEMAMRAEKSGYIGHEQTLAFIIEKLVEV
ncbi:MAG: hypothetical protein HQL05_02060 [Nitrospirae bacterium]|uniref:hypothetical protein n=1 Tax=Candidatus Magnetobacterium casense TaxID=1455061 RepID=UPI00058CEC2F|nr:hypothetical protein [Candidatus Magnetobacterium casensis]MBF0336594.1 hypothetical protein [Nitrospirota bacterium]